MEERHPDSSPATTPSLDGQRDTVTPRREDRILHEIQSTGGDVRRISDLVGLSVEAPPATSRPSKVVISPAHPVASIGRTKERQFTERAEGPA